MAKNVGRPRDENLEQRAFEAARAIYANRGWSGFTFDAVAKLAGVGKSSLYRRWSSKAELLLDLVRSRALFISEINTGTLRGDLIAFARGWSRFVDSDDGALTYRLNIDARFFPELRDALGEVRYQAYVGATRAIVHRGITRGELPSDTSVTLVADLVAGAVSNHVRNIPPHLKERASAQLELYIGRVVDTVLAGVRATVTE